MSQQDGCSICAFQSVQLCRALRSARCDAQAGEGCVRHYDRDEMLYEVGSCPGLIGILSQGYLRRERLMSDGRRTVLGLVFPGGIVGELPDWAAGYSLEAASDAEVCLFSKRAVLRLATEDADFRRSITADLERQYNHELTFAWMRMGLRCRERVMAFLVVAADLLGSAAEPDGSVVVTIPFGRRDWADLCNTTVESISRQVAELSAEGLIEQLGGRRYRLRDIRALCRRAKLAPPSFANVAPRMTAVNADRLRPVPSVRARAPMLELVARNQ